MDLRMTRPRLELRAGYEMKTRVSTGLVLTRWVRAGISPRPRFWTDSVSSGPRRPKRGDYAQVGDGAGGGGAAGGRGGGGRFELRAGGHVAEPRGAGQRIRPDGPQEIVAGAGRRFDPQPVALQQQKDGGEHTAGSNRAGGAGGSNRWGQPGRQGGGFDRARARLLRFGPLIDLCEPNGLCRRVAFRNPAA